MNSTTPVLAFPGTGACAACAWHRIQVEQRPAAVAVVARVFDQEIVATGVAAAFDALERDEGVRDGR